jgi:5-methylcytosine-specific restriction endonuclease McrA
MHPDSKVLLLNQNYEPLNVCTMRRAIVLVIVGKAEVLENSRGYIHTSTRAFPRPSVIRLVYMIHRPHPRARLTRKEVFRRDNYTCQYCGRQTKDLTLDHVVPRRRGGGHTWENLVSACQVCNRRKGGKTLKEAHMRLLRQPYEPTASYYYLFRHYLQDHAQWEKFLKGWM